MTFSEKILGVLALTALLACGIQTLRLEHVHAKQEAAVATALEKKAAEVGVAVGTPTTALAAEAHAAPANRAAVAKLKAVDHGTKVVEHSTTTVELRDTVPLNDGRFHLNGALLERHESFRLDAVIVTGADGLVRAERVDFAELDPVTGIVIPSASGSPKIVTHFEFVKEEPAAPPVFHPRAVAGFGFDGHGPALGAGVELLNGERFGGPWAHTNLSVLGLYDTQSKSVSGAAVLGFRPFDWNLSVGPAYFFPGQAVGVGATLELTR